MRFNFNFLSGVWLNLRSRIRALGLDSLWFKSLSALIGNILVERSTRASWLFKQLWLESSDGYGLTLWGQRYSIARFPGEPDDDFRTRILTERSLLKGEGSNANRKKILSYIYHTDNIRIERLCEWNFAIGGEIGEPIGNLDFARFSFRIYVFDIPSTQFSQANHSKAIQLLSSINVFGNFWDLFLQSDNGDFLDIPFFKASSSYKDKFFVF